MRVPSGHCGTHGLCNCIGLSVVASDGSGGLDEGVESSSSLDERARDVRQLVPEVAELELFMFASFGRTALFRGYAL